MNRCPKCFSDLRPIGGDFFCLDCDYDTLKPSFQGTANTQEQPRRHRLIEVDSEWYMKTQLRQYRDWTHIDFFSVDPDYIHVPKRYGYTTNYFHRTTVEAHENTDFFTDVPRRKQRPVPDDKKITELSYDLTVRGDELMRAGWTAEMIDALAIHTGHKWRRKRLFLLCDLTRVSKVFCVGPQVVPTPPCGSKYQPRRFW